MMDCHVFDLAPPELPIGRNELDPGTIKVENHYEPVNDTNNHVIATKATNDDPNQDFLDQVQKQDDGQEKLDVKKMKKAKRKGKKRDYVGSILDQDHANVIDFFENVDPMLAWALLKAKILPKVSLFDLVAEKSKLKLESWEPVTVVKTVMDDLDVLLLDVSKMLTSCCEKLEANHNGAESVVNLSQGLSLCLTGQNQSHCAVKSLEDFPLSFKEKLFKPQEMKPLDLVKTELDETNNDDNEGDAAANNDTNETFDEDFINDEGPEEDEVADDDVDDEDFKEPTAIKPEVSGEDTKKKRGIKKRAPKTCEKCHKTYNTQTQFRIHQRDSWRCPGKPEPKWLRIVKGKDYYCLHPDCSTDGVNGPMFPRRNKFWHHLKDKHWNRDVFPFDCTYCQEKFPFFDMLRQHIKQYHEKAHVCKYCGSSFSRRRDLTLHERRHTGEKPYACDKCEFRCNTAGSLRMHTVRRHEDPNMYRTHVCEICGKSFHAAYILKEHILTHSDIKRYTCDICGRQLRNDSCYRRHMMNIHGQKISCDQCSKDFSSPIGVKIHKRDAHGIMY